MDLWIEFYFALSEKWAVGVMGCRSNGLSELWAVGIMLRIPFFHINNILQLSMYHCMTYIYNKYNQTVVSIHAGFLTWYKHRRLCRVKNMLAMYLKYHKAGLTPTTPVTSIAISPVKMSIGRKSITNLRSEMILLQGKPVFLYLPTIYTPILTDNPQIWLTMDT